MKEILEKIGQIYSNSEDEIIEKIGQIYSDSEEETRQRITVNIMSSYSDTIFEQTKKVTGVGVDVRTPGRQRHKSDLVKIFCHYARYTLKFTTSRIAWYINRHHASVLNACKKYEYHYETDKGFRKKAEFYEERFKNIDGCENEEPNKTRLLEKCKCVSEEKAKKLMKIFLDYDNLSKIIVKSETVAHE